MPSSFTTFLLFFSASQLFFSEGIIDGIPLCIRNGPVVDRMVDRIIKRIPMGGGGGIVGAF